MIVIKILYSELTNPDKEDPQVIPIYRASYLTTFKYYLQVIKLMMFAFVLSLTIPKVL